MRVSKIFIGCIIGLGVGSVKAQSDLQLGARPQGMGGAYVALANDANKRAITTEASPFTQGLSPNG